MTNIRTLTRGAYDVQKLRIQMGNRIVGNFKAKLGQAPSEKEDTLDAQGQMILKNLRAAYKTITDGVTNLPSPKKFTGNEVISSYTELALVDQYIALEESEKKHFKQLGYALREFPIYTQYLDHVCGVGPAMAGVIVSEIDIHKAEYPTCIWSYAGLDVATDGRGRSRRKEHLVEREYMTKEGKKDTRMSITFNPFLKTKLIGVLGPSFIKQNPLNCPYRVAYDNYKNRLNNHPAHQEKTKLHKHNMAVRFAVKRFLVDLYTNWRAIEGLPVATEYSEGKLGKVHKKAG